MTPQTIAVIPARRGSKRIPNKNVKLLGGYPLIAYSVVAAKMSRLVDKVVVSTDDVEIGGIATLYGADEIVFRPPEISGDTATDMEWVKHFLGWCEETYHNHPNYIVHLRPTSPRRHENLIDRALCVFNPESSSLRSVSEMEENIEKTFKMNPNTNLLASPFFTKNIGMTNMTNQTFKTSYKGNGLVDILRVETIKDCNSLHGNKIQGFLTEKTVELDTIEDWDYEEYLLQTRGHWILEFLRRKDYSFNKNREPRIRT